MASCSYCGSETTVHVNSVPICEACADAVRGNAARSFAQVNEALTLARQEYYDALAGHRGDPDDTEAIRKANNRLDAASLAREGPARIQSLLTPRSISRC
jgi:hypothetical protein